MTKPLQFLLGLGVCLLVATTALAKPDMKLFHAQVVVKDRSQAVWQAGVRKALSDVLVKVSGNQNINELPTIKQSNPNLESLVQSYSYSRKVLYGGLKQLFLDVQFENDEIAKLLNSQQLSVWGGRRGNTVVWLTLPSDQGRPSILARDQFPEYVSILKGAAEKRGISLVLPEMDLTEISSISARDIVNKNISLVNEVSKRYSADNFLIANVSFDDDQYWHMSCLWVSGAGRVSWELQDASIDNLLAQSVNQLTDQMVRQFAHFKGSDSGTSTMLVRVMGVNGINDYTTVIDYLKQLTPIKEVDVETIESEAVILAVTYGGDDTSLKAAISKAVGNRLVPVDNDAIENNQSEAEVALVYRWLPPITTAVYQDSTLQ